MQIIGEKIKNTRSVSFSLVLPRGVINESATKTGITHLIEHLCFRRAEGLSQKDLYHFCEQRGVKIYASTGKNFLEFSFTARADVFDDIIRIFYKMFYGITYDEQELIVEKNIVRAEMAEYGRTNADIVIDGLWYNGKFAYEVMGSEKTLNNIFLEDIRKYKKRLLTADGAVFLFGNFTDEQRAFIEKSFSGKEIYKRKAESVKERNVKNAVKFIKDEYDEIDIYYAFHVMLSDKNRKNEILYTEILEDALFYGDAAYFRETLRESLGYVYDIESNVEVIENEAVLIFCVKAKKTNVCEVTSEIERLLEEFVFDERIYSYIRAFYCDNLEMFYDNIKDYATKWVNNYILFGEVVSPTEKAEMIRNISLEELNGFYKEILKTKNVYFFGNINLRQKKDLLKIVK